MAGHVRGRFTADKAEKAVSECKGLLDLHSRNVDAAGVKALGSALMHAPHVKGLNLYLNQLGVSGAKEVARMLEDVATTTKVATTTEVATTTKVTTEFEFRKKSSHDGRRPHVRQMRKSQRPSVHPHKPIIHVQPHAKFIVGSPCRDSPMRRRMLMKLSSSCKSATTAPSDVTRSSRRPMCCKTPPYDRKRMSDYQAKSLKEVNLDSNGMGEEGAIAIADALSVNRSLVSLAIAYNRITGAGGIALSSVLERNGTLTALDIEGNNLKDAGLVLLERALDSNIRVLNLSCNNISDRDGERIAKLLLLKSCPKALLSTGTRASMTERERKEKPSAAEVKQFPHRELLLRSNRIGIRGLIAISRALDAIGRRGGPGLVRVDVQYNVSKGIEANKVMLAISLMQYIPPLDVCQTIVNYFTADDVRATV
ncbi:hypothetical protein AAMO2058_000174500 [Amorphochlora amoebiformis]